MPQEASAAEMVTFISSLNKRQDLVVPTVKSPIMTPATGQGLLSALLPHQCHYGLLIRTPTVASSETMALMCI